MPNYSEVKNIGNIRDRVLKDREEMLIKNAGTLEQKLIRKIFDSILDNLERAEDGIIKNTTANMRALQRLDKIYRQFIREDFAAIIKAYVKDLSGIMTLNERYFALTTETNVTDIAKSVAKKLNQRLGIDGNKLIDGGFLDSFVNDTRIRNDIKSRLMKGITAGEGINTLKSSIREMTEGKPGVEGKFKQYFKTYLTDTLHQYNNATSKGFADALKLNYAVYAGTEIKTSRLFCRLRMGTVFTREEISRFGTSQDTYGGYTDLSEGEFQGKNENYNPFDDLGGYNCRHSWNWIPEYLAFRMRPELKTK